MERVSSKARLPGAILLLVCTCCSGATTVENHPTTTPTSRLGGTTSETQIQPPATLSTQEVAALARPHVLKVTAGENEGSAFFVRNDLVVTCFHVVRGQESVSFTGTNWTGKASSVVAWDERSDLAVLRVAPARSHPGLRKGAPAQPGARVIVISSPLGLADSVSDGVISAQRDTPNGPQLQITAPISPGSSGGPVLDGRGEVVGIVASTVTAIEGGRTYGQNLNFATPASLLPELLGRQTSPYPCSQRGTVFRWSQTQHRRTVRT